jgi:hypothetical protein
MLPAKLAISYINIFTSFYQLKNKFKFLASGCRAKGPLPSPPQTQDNVTIMLRRELRVPGQS